MRALLEMVPDGGPEAGFLKKGTKNGIHSFDSETAYAFRTRCPLGWDEGGGGTQGAEFIRPRVECRRRGKRKERKRERGTKAGREETNGRRGERRGKELLCCLPVDHERWVAKKSTISLPVQSSVLKALGNPETTEDLRGTPKTTADHQKPQKRPPKASGGFGGPREASSGLRKPPTTSEEHRKTSGKLPGPPRKEKGRGGKGGVILTNPGR